LVALGILASWLLRTRWARETPKRRRSIRAGVATIALLLCASGFWSIPQLAIHFPVFVVTWVRGIALLLGVVVCSLLPVAWVWRRVPEFDPKRRQVLRTFRLATFAAPPVAAAFAVLRRNDMRLHAVDVPIAGLSRDLDGLRLVQLSDIHLSPFFSEAELDYAIGMANETRPHVALVTGDLISGPRDPIDRCIERLRTLRADAGVLGCMGNHERYAEVDDFTEQHAARYGMLFLREQSRQLRFGGASINFAGVDYQRFWRPYLVSAQRMIAPGMLNVLLSHNPDVLKTAAAQGWDLTLAGHTHGGQVNFEIISANINVARVYTPYIHGLYKEGKSSLFVTRGIGTIGVPARLGAPPEIALITLRSA
jgi:predicted MPP superfamily phosphohydrolase